MNGRNTALDRLTRKMAIKINNTNDYLQTYQKGVY